MIERGRDVIAAEAEALTLLRETLGLEFGVACDALLGLRRQLVVTGMGKSGHIARKVAATFSATGTPAIYIHPSEAGHGDLGMLMPDDILLVFSNSGNTGELRPILHYARRSGIFIIGVASRSNSLVIEMADTALMLPNLPEACSVNIAPTSSSVMQLALGDALAMAVMDRRGISRSKLSSLHPSGTIGLSLTPIRDLMHSGARIPLVHVDRPLEEAIWSMTSCCFGLAGVIDDDGALIGVITDGDLRRNFQILGQAAMREVMTANPKMIAAEMSAQDALLFLNDNQITAAFVVEDPQEGPQRPLGIIHVHDLLRQGLS